MRTTLDIDTPVLTELKKIQKEEGLSLGRIVSNLLVEALTLRQKPVKPSPFNWVCKDMQARIDLADKDALHNILDRP